jgi:hypothetical protein
MKRRRSPLWGAAAALLFAAPFCNSESDAGAPARLFDAAAHVSFIIPEAWEFEPDFLTQPMLTWTSPEGGHVEILYAPSEPDRQARLQSELPLKALQDFAQRDIAARHPKARLLAAEQRTLAGRNAFEITWTEDEASSEAQSVVVFVDDHFITLTLKADKNVFPWQVPEFQKWLNAVQFLGRQDSGALTVPARGGIWLQREVGARVAFPEQWLIGAADDRLVAAALAQEDKHSEITITADPMPTPATLEVDSKTRHDARAGLAAKDFTVTAETEEPFHGYPALRLAYQGYRKNRFVKGIDLWIISPKAHWLINIEGDGTLFRHLGGDYRKILDGFEFL